MKNNNKKVLFLLCGGCVGVVGTEKWQGMYLNDCVRTVSPSGVWLLGPLHNQSAAPLLPAFRVRVYFWGAGQIFFYVNFFGSRLISSWIMMNKKILFLCTQPCTGTQVGTTGMTTVVAPRRRGECVYVWRQSRPQLVSQEKEMARLRAFFTTVNERC